jgi:hypothetical protein
MGASQARLEAEAQLDAGRAAADHDDARDLSRARARLELRVEAVDEVADRAGRQRVLAHTGALETAQRRADVEARDVVAERRPTLELHATRRGVDARGGREHHGGARASRQRHDVDLELRRAVLPGREARDHARVDRVGAVEHDRHPRRRQRRHCEAPEHLHVRMAAAHEHELLRDARALHGAADGTVVARPRRTRRYDRAP